MKVNSLKNKGESYSFPPLRTTQIALTPMNSPSDYETEQHVASLPLNHQGSPKAF